ncbi:MAG: hypothetical protein CK532_00745 [Flavobacteriales bacterium]|nr:T9SS type A sorting domain-containing protein [Flavobacteriaceae bacterium]PHX93222.1 MAG: hypothetical protein CK532_00745 [Flavobacteriales bacterium]
MKRIKFFVIAFTLVQIAIARPVVNLNGRANTGRLDRRSGQMANTCEPASQSADLDVNNVRTKLLNGGDMWWDLNNPKYEIPKINDPNAVRKHSLFSGAIWIGGKDNGGSLKLAAMTYRQRGSDFWPGPLDTTTAATDPLRCKAYDKMWKVTRDELETFENSKYLTQSAGIRDWPAGRQRAVLNGNEAKYLAPYKEITPDGVYNPFDGEHPVLDDRRPSIDNGVEKQPDMFIWWVYNDKGNIHSETQGQPIGVEIQTTGFAFATNDEVNNMTFYSSKIINRGFTTLNDCYMGEWVDADLGNYADDYVGCDVGRSLGFCYNGDDDDEGVLGYGLNPPTIGVDYFEGPTDSVGNQMGLSHFMYYNNDQNAVSGNPGDAIEFYNLMQGKWLGGQNVTWGGTGFGGSRPAKYMFPGDTDPEHLGESWTEKSSGNKPGDRRFIQSTGPFTLRPGQIQRITLGVVWARTTSGGSLGSLNLLRLASDKAQTLFNNNFKILDGPNSPDIEIQELEQELVLKFLNTNSSKVEYYKEKYKDAKNQFRTYKFEGYLVYQLKDATVSTTDLENVDKARLLFQCDVKNNRAQIINKVYDPKLATLIPVEKVDGADKGVQHTWSIKNDLFATIANTQLVDFKPVYYLVLSYAILADDTLQLDPNQFLAGRRNIKVIKAIPHKSEPENFGTELNSIYGGGPELMRLSGRGNGGNELNFTKETLKEILEKNVSSKPVYKSGTGPVKIKVVDPLKVPNAKFEFVFKENKISLASGLKDSMTKNTKWFMVKKGENGANNDTIFSDTTIAYRFESVQGKKGANNATKQTLADWGLSVEVEQMYNPGENSTADPSNGLLSWTLEWEDNGKQWLTAINDNDGQSTENAGALWLNWIRGGSNGRGGTFNPLIHDFFNQDGSAVDPGQAFERIWGGRIAPYGMVAREKMTATGRNTFGFAWWGNSSGLQNPISELASIELVITPDKTLWTRCPVIEMADDEMKNSVQGQMGKFNMRWGNSKDKNGNEIAGSQGLGWFPGYAINMETGERLALAFSEDSYLVGENGRDMIWNPTDKVYNDNGIYPAMGGKHFIYIFGTGLTGISRNVRGERYMGEDEANFQRFKTALLPTAAGGSTNTLDKTRLLTQVMWVIPTYMAQGFSMKDGIPPTTVKFKINIRKAYTSFDAGNNVNNNRPMYEFDAASIAPKISNDIGKKNLDLVNVVPNPYRGYSAYENSPLDSRVKITNLPPECTISIFDMAGNLIRKIKKSDDNTFYEWDLKNGSNVPISSGLYLIHIKTKNLGEKVVRWYGIMHAIDLDIY